jgi:hypothetical protein
MKHYEYDVSYDYGLRKNVVLIDPGDGESIILTKQQLEEMLESLNEADLSAT